MPAPAAGRTTSVFAALNTTDGTVGAGSRANLWPCDLGMGLRCWMLPVTGRRVDRPLAAGQRVLAFCSPDASIMPYRSRRASPWRPELLNGGQCVLRIQSDGVHASILKDETDID
jgi:hypothetical protein